jgi:hypothetical protein
MVRTSSNSRKMTKGELIYCLLMFLALPFLIISFIWMIKARKEINILKKTFQSLTYTWEEDAVFEISATENGFSSLSSNQLAQKSLWKTSWPGTVEGCYCDDTKRGRGVRRGTNVGKCNRNETRVGCTQHNPVASVEMSRWIASQQIYALRIRGTSFYDVYTKIDSQGNCQTNYKNCGDKTTTSKGFCIPNTIPTCPITAISDTAEPGYTPASGFIGFSLNYISQPQKQPITYLSMGENKACFIRTHRPLTAGRKKYPLLDADYEDCKIDDSVKKIASPSVGERDLFDINSIPYSGFKQYDTDNKYKYNLIYSSPLEWSPDCIDTVPSFKSKPQDLVDLQKQYTILFVLYIISLSMAGFKYFFTIYFLNIWSPDTRKQIYKFIFLFRLIGFLIAAPSIMIVTIKLKQFQGFFQNITNLKCSSDLGNTNFQVLSDSINSKVHRKNLVMITLSYIGMAYEACIAFCYLKIFWNME